MRMDDIGRQPLDESAEGEGAAQNPPVRYVSDATPGCSELGDVASGIARRFLQICDFDIMAALDLMPNQLQEVVLGTPAPGGGDQVKDSHVGKVDR